MCHSTADLLALVTIRCQGRWPWLRFPYRPVRNRCLSVHGGGGMHVRGCAWQGRGMYGRGGVHARRFCMQGCMQERRPLKWSVRIILECILVTHLFGQSRCVSDVVR